MVCFLLCDLYHKKEKKNMKKGKMEYKSKMRQGSPGKALVEIHNTNQGHLERRCSTSFDEKLLRFPGAC